MPKANSDSSTMKLVLDELGDLREDIIMLVRLVERGWWTSAQAMEKLREISEEL